MRRMTGLFAWLVVALAVPAAFGQQTLRVEPIGPSPVVVLPAGSGFSARVELDTAEVVQGWSYGICNDDSIVVLDSADIGSTTATINGGDPPGFENVAVFPNGISSGIVIDLFGVETLPAGNDYELRILNYSVAPGVMQPASGDPDIMSSIAPCDTVGAPPVTTVIVVNGASIVPTQEGFDVLVPAAAECEFACVAGVDNVDVTWNNCNPGGPADYYMLFRDGVLLNVFDDGTQVFADTGLAPGPYHYELLAVSFPVPNGPPTILQGSCDVDVIPVTLDSIDPTVGVYQGGDMVTLMGSGFLAAPDTTVTIAGLTAVDIMILDDNTLTCLTPAVDFIGPVDVVLTNSLGGGTLVDGFTYGFIRGQIGADTSIDIADPIFLLDYLFEDGPEPACIDAADANDDGGIDLADAIYVVNYLFISGPEPPPPFTTPGDDPTPDGLGCGMPAP